MYLMVLMTCNILDALKVRAKCKYWFPSAKSQMDRGYSPGWKGRWTTAGMERGSTESALHPAGWTAIPHSSLGSAAWSGRFFVPGNDQIFWDWFMTNLFVLPAGRSLIYWSVQKIQRGQICVRVEVLLGVISAWFSSPSLPALCFTSSLIPTESQLHTQLL